MSGTRENSDDFLATDAGAESEVHAEAHEEARGGGTHEDGPEADTETETAGAADAPPAAADPVVELQDAHDALNDRHIRLVAEFENFRRRVNQERVDAWARAQAELVGKFLDSLDDLQRVSDLDPESATTASVLEGVELVERKFLRTLLDAGIEEMNPEGEPFDPNTMEAVMRADTDDPARDDHVAQVFQKGYLFKGHLVRPARVSVFKDS
jgi:molecular chaperone GrpE